MNRITTRKTRLFAQASATLALLAVTTAAVTPVVAESLNGPTRTFETVAARDCDDYNVTFRGGERARVWATGDGDIDIVIYDAAGNRIVSDTLSDARPSVAWTPPSTRTYKICVDNTTGSEIDYVLRTN